MKKTVTLSILLFFSLLFSQDYSALHVIQKVDDGFIDWTERIVTVTGSGVPEMGISNVVSAKLSAEKTARNNAMHRFIKALLKIDLTGGRSLEKYLVEIKDPEFRKNIESDAQWDEMVLSNYNSDGSVDYIFKFNMESKLSEIIKRVSCDIPNEPAGKTVEGQSVSPSEQKSFLVIDARKLKMEPLLLPTIETAKGEVVFNPAGTYYIRQKPDPVLEKFNSLTDFLLILPQKIKDKSKMIVTDEDALKIKTILKPEAFSEGRIIILLK